MRTPLLLAALLGLAACARDARLTFTDVTADAGLAFGYTYGDDTYENIMESSGSGVTVFDYDGDGWMDVYLANGTYLEGLSDPEGRRYAGSLDRLYHNEGDGTFTDVTGRAGVSDTLWTMAATAFDYDADGDPDLFVSNYGPNALYRNEGDGTFTDVTDAVGLRGPERLGGFPKWSAGAAAWDADADGAVDLMVCNFLAFDPAVVSDAGPAVMPHPAQYHGQPSLLYRQAPDGRFTDATRDAGLFFPEARCMGLTPFDYDGDGDQDLFQANDHQPNYLFRRDGRGAFEEVGTRSGVAVNDQGVGTGSMHGTPGDVDGDGRLDLLVVDLEHGALYRNLGAGLFTDATRASGLEAAFAGKGAWAASLFDFDNDGDLDVFSANGAADELLPQLPLLLANDGAGRFTDAGPTHGPYFRHPRSGRGAAAFDYDNDGDLDLLVSHLDGRPTATLLRNDGGPPHHWLGLTLQGRRAAADALGAVVTLYAGGRRQVAVNQATTSYLSSHDPRLHFGLGASPRVDSLVIRWAGGAVQVLRGLAADRYHTLVQETPQDTAPDTARDTAQNPGPP